MRFLGACLLCASLAAQDLPKQDPGLAAGNATPTLQVAPSEQPCEIVSAQYAIQVRGLFAQTTATLTFRNPNRRQLAGEFEFPLPDGATICGYALDIQGVMVDGVIIGKDAGRVIVESLQRQRIDPGLAEQVRGNVFRTHLFPLPPAGTRTVRLTWTSQLSIQGAEASARVPLPRLHLPQLELQVAIDAGAVVPRLGGFGNLSLTRWQHQSVAQATLTDVTPGDDLFIRLPELPAHQVLVESRSGEVFVALDALPPACPLPARSAPHRIAVAWDACGARTPMGIARGREILTQLLAAWPGTTLDVVVFRDVPEPSVACTTLAQLTALLDAIAYDGGSCLARLDLRRGALPRSGDAQWLLLGDGLGTIGETVPPCDDVPVVALACESVRDSARLRLIARRTGGESIDAMALSATQVVLRITRPALHLLRIDAADGVLSDVECGATEDRGQVMARLLRDGDITLVFGAPGVPAQPVVLHAQLADALPGEVIARAWAGAMAEDLAIDPASNRERLLALGRRYGVVTPGTSLIVLDSLWQYERYGIMPPATFPELQAQFQNRMKLAHEALQDTSRVRLNTLARRWADQVAWWEGHGPLPDAAGYGRSLSRPATTPRAPIQGQAQDEGLPQGRQDDLLNEESGGQGFFMAAGVSRGGGSPGGGGFGYRAPAAAVETPAADPTALAGTIALAPFAPMADFLNSVAGMPMPQAYASYLRERASHASSPGFFLDCASFFLPRDADLGHRILSNLAGMHLDDPALLRIYAWRLEQAGDLTAAIGILRAVEALRPDQPQSYRDLALVLDERAQRTHHAEDAEEAMRLLYAVVTASPLTSRQVADPQTMEWSWNRVPDIDLIALEELNRLIARSAQLAWDRPLVVPAIDHRLQGNLDCDVRVVMGWDRDDTDIDLHVLEPGGEEAYYGHRLTSSGAQVSHDNTVGYGPEEYQLRHAPAGSYQVRCVYFGSHSTELFGPATVVATVFLDWGRPSERRLLMTLRLDATGEAIPVGTVQINASGAPAVDRSGLGGGTITHAQIDHLSRGMSRQAVEAALGLPARIDGGGLVVLVYRLAGADAIRVGLGPQLLWVREVMDGVEHDLLQ